MGTLENACVDEFGKWLSKRPQWLQTAAANFLVSQQLPSQEEISQLADLAIAEVEGPTSSEFKKCPVGAFSCESLEYSMQLKKIDNIVGVNAIFEGAMIDFCGGLTVVFGQNGSGKSGYARMIKHACDARKKINLLSNIYEDQQVEPKASFVISEKGNDKTVKWSLYDGPLDQLRHVHVFDGLTANSYVNDCSQATYEPRKLWFISKLIKICDGVAIELRNKKAACLPSLPSIPSEFDGTVAASFIGCLNPDVSVEECECACAFTENAKERKKVIETSLSENDVVGKLKELSVRKQAIRLFEKQIKSLADGTSESKVLEIEKSKNDAILKRKAASEDAEKVFGAASLDGVGKESWAQLWKSARLYSEKCAYPGKDFPFVEDGAVCVLCHQPLDRSVGERLSSFEKFVKGNLEAEATAAELKLKNLLSTLPKLVDKEKWLVDIKNIEISEEYAESIYAALESCLSSLNEPGIQRDVSVPDWTIINHAIVSTLAKLSETENTLTDIHVEGERQKIEKELQELKASEWLSINSKAVREEVVRLKKIATLSKAEGLANTISLTRKKNDLTDDELASGYRERFLHEIKLLAGTRLPIEHEPIKEGKGKVSFALSLKGAKCKAETGLVLSEGESRVAALAAFLADITGSGLSSPFVFDDPISSLDQEYEENVAERLVELSRSRQVIIFTHRLSFVALVDDALNSPESKLLGDALDHSFVSLRRIDGKIGIIDNLDIRHNKPLSGFNALLFKKVPQFKKHSINMDISSYESLLKTICSDFRILIERTIEKILLGGSVERFRRQVYTRNINVMTKVNASDCAFIHKLMTKYSIFEHSQPDELASRLPTVDELTEDLMAVINWIDAFNSRIA